MSLADEFGAWKAQQQDQQPTQEQPQEDTRSFVQRAKDNLVDTVSNFIEGAQQGINELGRAQDQQTGNTLQQMYSPTGYQLPTTEQNQQQQQYVAKAQNNLINETLPFVPSMTLPAVGTSLVNNAVDTYQNTEGTPLQKTGNAIRSVTYGPAVDMYNDPTLAQQFQDKPLSTIGNAAVAGLQAVLPLEGARRGFKSAVEIKTDLMNHVDNQLNGITDSAPLQGIGIQGLDAMDQLDAPNQGFRPATKQELQQTVIDQLNGINGQKFDAAEASYKTPDTVQSTTDIQPTSTVNFVPQADYDLGLEHNDLVNTLGKSGIDPILSKNIADNIINDRRQNMRVNDDVTGYQKPEYLQPTLQRAWNDHTTNGNDYSLASVDFANLGGLNQHVNNISDVANTHFRNVTDIIKQSVEDSGIKNAQFIRSGGDEFQILAPGIDKVTLDKAMNDAKMKVDQYAQQNGLSDILHPKTGQNSGIGIHYGVEDMSSVKSIKGLKENSESGLSLSKQSLKDGAGNVGRSEITKTGIDSLEKQSAGIKESLGTENTIEPKTTKSTTNKQQVESPINGGSFDLNNKLNAGFDPTGGKFDNVDLGKPVKEFAKRDIAEPAKTNLGYIKETYKDLVGAVNPSALGEKAQLTKDKLVKMMGHSANNLAVTAKGLEDARKLINRNETKFSDKFVDAYEKGKSHDDPVLNKAFDTMRKQSERQFKELKDLGALEGNGIKDYIRHLYKKTPESDAILNRAPKTLEGTKGFLKPREFETMAQARAAGMKPISDNAIEQYMIGHAQIEKYIAARKIIADLESQGLTHRGFENIPDGWKRINEHAGFNNLYVPEEVANVVNNYLSPGISGKGAFQIVNGIGNAMLRARLGVSFFHAGFTTGETIVSHIANGIFKMTHGDKLEGAKDIAQGVFNPAKTVYDNFQSGRQLRKELLNPGTQGERMASIAEMAKDAGMRAKMDSVYAMNSVDKVLHEWHTGNPIGAALRAPFAAIEQISKPIMEHLVPIQKMGTFAKMAEYELGKHPYATEAERLRILQKQQFNVDNRFGEMVYDNVFANKTAKDISHLLVQSVGWNGGSWREIGGGLYDTSKAIKNLATRQPSEFTHRMAYIASMTAVTAWWGAVATYLVTGKAPQTMKDYFYPPDGGTDKDGRPSRFALPTYMKDVYHYFNNFGETVGNKLHPLLGMANELFHNRDFFGKEIYNKDDSLFKTGFNILKYLGSGFLPYSITGTKKNLENGQSLGKSLLPMIGLTPAPGDVNKTKAERLMMEYAQGRRPEGTRTQIEADKADFHRKIVKDVQLNGGKPTQSLYEALKNKELSPKQAQEIVQMGKVSPVQRSFEPLSIDQAIKVMQIATPEEKQQLTPLFNKKVQNWLPKSNADEREKFLPMIKGLKK